MEEITLQVRFSTADEIHPSALVRQVLDGALRNEAELADGRRTFFERSCHSFEQRFKMSSDEFMRRFESGDLGDEAAYFDWYAAKRGLDLWTWRFDILAGVQI
ncbi:MAG: hypothetical protein JW934_15155 [Anaerolineae bacterium]|nr:hypothetical protein [Anaerolineae bacterium]